MSGQFGLRKTFEIVCFEMHGQKDVLKKEFQTKMPHKCTDFLKHCELVLHSSLWSQIFDTYRIKLK